MESYSFSEYISSIETGRSVRQDNQAETEDFAALCRRIKNAFYTDWESRENSAASLEIQKRAIIGYEKEKAFFKDRIRDLIAEFSAGKVEHPPWYPDLVDAVYHENWGFAGLAQWFSPPFDQESSAKIVGERIYFMEDGHMRLMPQTIDRDRLEQLIKAMLLLTPEERFDKAYYETYLLDGTRVTVFTEPMAKKGQASVIFRRYLIPSLSFEQQVQRGTIPAAAVPLFEAMVDIGFNVVMTGAVRTAKTTFLSTWQSYEDPTLEGVMVETDPEIPMHKLLPDAPIIQLLADGDDLRRIAKNLLRSDADYFILAEARDGIALDTAVKLAAKGTKRMKMTFHSRLAEHFPLEAATEIVKATGGDLRLTMQMVASGFDYIFCFMQLPDKRRKRLKGIYQMNCDAEGEIRVEELCRYDPVADNWSFYNILDKNQEEYGLESNPGRLAYMKQQLVMLEASSPVS